MNDFLVIDSIDNVGIALQDLKIGQKLNYQGKDIVLLNDIPMAHKFALKDISDGEMIIKYGYPIAHAINMIHSGAHIHTHNAKTNLNDKLSYTYQPINNIELVKSEERFFKGYPRFNKQFGIRNDLYILPTVGCVNGNARMIAKEFMKNNPQHNFDNILVLTHPYGCSQLGDDHNRTKQIISDIITHQNAGATLVLGLGCENNGIQAIIDDLGSYDEKRVRFLIAQDVEDEVETGLAYLDELNSNASGDQRIDVPLNKLVVGLKCGGSDGFSGISANPLLGWFSDYLIAQGGSAILTEVPEMFGAESILMNRAKDEMVFNDIVTLINDFKQFFIDHNQVIYENPSPGNKNGGITTLEEKSLGCTQKAGSAIVKDVIDYGEKVSKQGLSLLNAPGNDLVAATALAASGAHLVLFTTGRGTPFGTFVPTVKVSTNTKLYQNKPNWIDFNAGSLVDGKAKEAVIEEFIDYLIKVCSGQLVSCEVNDFQEIAIFKDGVTL